MTICVRRILAAAILVAASSSGTAGQAVKISQVFGGGGNPGAPYTRDYVELFNAGPTEVSLAGWSLQYATAAGTTWQSTALPNRSIGPGVYFLVQMSAAGTAGEALPSPDHTATPSINMSATSGKVALVRGTTALSGLCPSSAPSLQIIDLVGFGATASCFEGSGPAPAPSNTVVILRAGDGCVDTGQNATDFMTGAANPRNSAVSRPVCPGADLALVIEPDEPSLILENAGGVHIRVRNLGPDAAAEVTVVVTLPANAALAGSTPDATPVNNILSVPLGTLEVEESAEIFLRLIPFSGTQTVLSASVSSLSPDPKPGNDAATSTLPIFSFARARLFTGVKDPGGMLRAVDVDSGASKPVITASVSGLAADNENRRFFVSDGEYLSIVPWDTLTPVVVGRITGANGPMDGLAWHPSRRRLIGTTTATMYEIDLQSAAAKVLRTFPAGDFGGIDYDPSTNRVIAANNSSSTTGGLSGRGFYRINPYGTELLFLFAYPERVAGTPETDIDGCAIGGGRIYGGTDQAEWIYRYQQSTSSFLSPMPQPLTIDHGEAGSTFAPEFYSQSPGANLGVSIIGPRDCEAIDGVPLMFSVILRNFGPAYAASPTLTVTLPATAAFIASTPSLTPAGGVITYSLPGLAVGESVELGITMQPSGASPYTVSATGTSATADALPLNNTASRDFVTQASLPPAPAATAVLSTLPGSNGVPGREGTRFSNADFGRIFRSPSGRWWMMAASTDAPAATDRVLIRGGVGGIGVVAQEGVTMVPDLGVPVGEFGIAYAVLDNGDFAFTTDTSPDASLGMVAIKSMGGGLSVIAEQGSGNIPTGLTYGGSMGSITLQNDGSGSFTAQVGSGAGASQVFLTRDGATMLLRTAATVPSGQLAAPMALEAFGVGATEGQITWMNGAGDRWCTRGDLAGPTATDICLIVDGTVRIQEGFRIPGSTLTGNVSAIHATDLDSTSGTVYCRGSNADGKDWAWRDGQVIASTGAPIAQGSTETFADNVFARCFFLATGNSVGDVVIGGFTNAANTNANEVIVLNNQHVLLRENDPIDIDGDGLLDDDARIHSFREHSAFLTDDGWLYAVVRVRSSSSVCLGAPADIGQALIRTRVLCPADFNRDGIASVPDIFAFLSAWFAQSTAADFDGDGQIAVPDIFAFLSAWFRGC